MFKLLNKEFILVDNIIKPLLSIFSGSQRLDKWTWIWPIKTTKWIHIHNTEFN